MSVYTPQVLFCHLLTPCSLAMDFVIVVIGDDKKETIVHQQPLCSASRFFDAALKNDWKEKEQNKIFLPEETPALFEIYVLWVYTGKLFTEDKTLTMEAHLYPYATLFELYNMGARLQDYQFQDAAIDAILSETTVLREGGYYFPPAIVIPIVYENSLPGDCARRLLVDMCILNRYTNHIRTDSGESYLQFAADVARATLSGSNAKDTKMIDDDGCTCHYHQHGSNELCYSRKLKDGIKLA